MVPAPFVCSPAKLEMLYPRNLARNLHTHKSPKRGNLRLEEPGDYQEMI